VSEILTVSEVSALLRLSKSQVYEMTNSRSRSGDVRPNPIPVLRMGSAVRFLKADVEKWINDQRGTEGRT
jgi:predicted DNA-binding transcriptional regulator AlpA